MSTARAKQSNVKSQFCDEKHIETCKFCDSNPNKRIRKPGRRKEGKQEEKNNGISVSLNLYTIFACVLETTTTFMRWEEEKITISMTRFFLPSVSFADTNKESVEDTNYLCLLDVVIELEQQNNKPVRRETAMGNEFLNKEIH